MSDPAPNSYAALGVRLHEIAASVGDLLTPEETVFLFNLADVELPAADEIIQSATFASLTVAQEALAARRQCSDLQESNSGLHQGIITLQARLDAAIQGEKRLADIVLQEPAR